MCSHYQAPFRPETYLQAFKATAPADLGRTDVWPGYVAGFIRKAENAPYEREVRTGLFGMVPHWATDAQGTKYTYNARTETVADKPSYRDAWAQGQHCIIPAQAIYEPDWRSGRAIPARIERADNRPMGIAGLWSSWMDNSGNEVLSFTMLTINADEHPFMCQFHKPTDEKRMVIILREDQYSDWLHAPAQSREEFFQAYPADWLTSYTPEPSQTALF